MSGSHPRAWGAILCSLIPFGAGQVCALLSLLWLARRLEPANYGALSFGLAIQSYLAMLGGMGIRTLILRDASGGGTHQGTLLTSHMAITSVASTAWALLVALWILVGMDSPPEEKHFQLWLLFGACCSAMNPSPFLDASNQQVLGQTITAVSEGLLLAGLYLAVIPSTLSAVGCALALKLLLSLGLTMSCVMRLIPVSTWKFDAAQIAELMHRSWPLLITSLLATWPISGTVIFVKQMCGNEAAAVMGFAVQVASAILLMAGVAYRFLQPRVSTPEDLTQRFPLGFVLGLASGLMLIGGAALLVTWLLVATVLPVEYRMGFATVAVLLVSSLLGAWAYLGWACLLAARLERAILWSYLAGNVVFLLTVVPAISALGSLGAACSSVTANLVTLAVMVAFIRQARLISYTDTSSKNPE